MRLSRTRLFPERTCVIGVAGPSDLPPFAVPVIRQKSWGLTLDPFQYRSEVGTSGGFHRIRHYGLLANSNRRDNLALARQLLQVTPPRPEAAADDGSDSPRPTFLCAHCGHAMTVLQVFLRDCSIRAPPAS